MKVDGSAKLSPNPCLKHLPKPLFLAKAPESFCVDDDGHTTRVTHHKLQTLTQHNIIEKYQEMNKTEETFAKNFDTELRNESGKSK